MKYPAHFTRFGSRADGSAGLSFATQELTSEEFAELKSNLNSFGWLVFEPQENALEVPQEKVSDETKTPSMRLRAILYLIWKKNGEKGDFEGWYRGQMEMIISKLKAKLD